MKAQAAAQFRAGDYVAAVDSFSALVAAHPGDAGAWRGLGASFMRLSLADGAVAALAEAIACDPRDPENWLLWCVAHIPLLPPTAPEIDRSRAAFADALRLFQHAIAAGQFDPDRLAATVGRAHPFALAYQGRDDLELMRLYGALIAAMVEPQPSADSLRRPTAGRRLRIGFASAFFYAHSVWKIPLAGWLRHLDRSRFELFGYHLGAPVDAATAEAHGLCDVFRHGASDAAAWCAAIRGDALDVLIYPEIGMDPLTLRLAARRLAPIQAVGLGHPVTTGLAQMDLFLSSALMEPPGAQARYSERLVPLPGLGIAWRPTPQPPAPPPIPRDPARVDLWICQSPFKHLPSDDGLYAAIARQAPAARFLFLSAREGPAADALIERRLTSAFAQVGLRWDAAGVRLPRLSTAVFAAGARAADLFLDAPGWAGFNTALESLTEGAPLLTLAGDSCRRRHCAAVIAQAGAGGRVALDRADYVAHAAALINDPAARADLRAEAAGIDARRFDDPAPVRALETLLTAEIQ